MCNREPLISVIMPVYNAGDYLIDAVASILNQENITLEIILVDDHSTDDAIKNLPKELTQDSRFKFVSSNSRYDNKLFMKAKAHYLSRSHYLKGRKAIIWGTGPIGVYLYDILVEQKIEVEAFIDVNSRRIGGLKRGLPVLHFSEINQYTQDNKALIIGAVGARGARAEIRQALLNMGKEEGSDFLFAA